MSVIVQILELLEQKKKTFLEIESVTQAMSVVPQQELAQCCHRRGNLLDQVEKQDRKIRCLSEGQQQIRNALNHACDRAGLSKDLASIYLLSLEIKAIVNRVMQNEGIVKQRIELEKEQLLSKIESLNQSGSATANRYSRFVTTQSFLQGAFKNSKTI